MGAEIPVAQGRTYSAKLVAEVMSRTPLERIEVIRILPQLNTGEELGNLIEDPWKVIECGRLPPWRLN